MSDLAQFLLARIAEDEAEPKMRREGWTDLADMLPMGAWDSERVLAECAAKREIVEAARAAFEAEHSIRDTFAEHDDTRAKVERATYSATVRAWHETLRLLALLYASHPDFREEWRP